MENVLPFILNTVVPIIATLAILYRVSGARQNEERYYTLIGVLAEKGLLTMQDLNTLGVFSPREDVLKSLLELAGGG